MIRIDRTGQRFGRLTVLSCFQRVLKNERRTLYFCKCDCGEECTVRSEAVVRGKTTSCGCYRTETSRQNGKAVAAWQKQTHSKS